MKLKSTQLPNPQAEAKHIADNLRESHPQLNHPPQPPQLWKQRLNQVVSPVRVLKNLVLANPQDFHGQVYVTPELQDHSNLTARVISVASLFNAITNQPLLFFAFKDFGGLAIFASLTLNLLLIKFTNDNGTAVAGRKYDNQSWAKAGAAAMIAMSVLQSFAAGVGMEAMNNRPYLAELKAQEEIERQTENLQEIPASSEALEAAQREFQQLQGEFAGISRENLNWDTLHVQLYGTWADRDRDWSQVPLENLPLQQRVFRLERQAQAINLGFEHIMLTLMQNLLEFDEPKREITADNFFKQIEQGIKNFHLILLAIDGTVQLWELSQKPSSSLHQLSPNQLGQNRLSRPLPGSVQDRLTRPIIRR